MIVLPFAFFSAGVSYAGEPGIPDTVRFEPWGTFIPCPPCTGHAVVPLTVFNDESLVQFTIPLQWIGPLSCDTVEFTGRVLSLSNLSTIIYPDYNSLVLMGMTTDLDSMMPPGNAIIARIYFSLHDTGMGTIEEADLPVPELSLRFVDSVANAFIPEFLTSDHHIVPQDRAPGDVNQNGGVDLADIVFLINYLFKNGPAPPYPPCADPNIDCSVSLVDAVYLINYLFRSGRDPQPGCAY